MVNGYEIKRVIAFANRVRERFRANLPFSEPDPHWNIISHLIQMYLEGRPVSISGLVQVSNLPYGTATRRIHEMLDAGLIVRQARSATGKSFHLLPSASLLENFESYAREIKMELARVYGQAGVDDGDNYYFGGDHQRLAFNEEQLIEVKNIVGVEGVRFLLHHDYYFMSVRHMWSDFRRSIGPARNFSLRALHALHGEIIENSRRAVSSYDIIAVNAPWLGELASKGLVMNISDVIPDQGIRPESFHPQVWNMGKWQGRQYGVPTYATMEILSARRDLFDEAALKLPSTFDEVIAAGRRLHEPRKGRYGILWNGGRGMEIAHTFMFILGCCGAPIFDLARVRGGFEKDDLNGNKIRAMIDSYAAVEALDYMQELLSISPPDILQTSWSDCLERFISGGAGMIYTWSIHASRFETDIGSVVKRKIAYVQPPAGKRGRSLTPLGGFVLAIPTNLPPERIAIASDVIGWMSSPQAVMARAKDGLPLSSLFSLIGDPEAGANSPIYNLAKSLAQKRLLHIWQRPPIPQYSQIEIVLGEEIHDAHSGVKTVKEALQAANRRINDI